MDNHLPTKEELYNTLANVQPHIPLELLSMITEYFGLLPIGQYEIIASYMLGIKMKWIDDEVLYKLIPIIDDLLLEMTKNDEISAYKLNQKCCCNLKLSEVTPENAQQVLTDKIYQRNFFGYLLNVNPEYISAKLFKFLIQSEIPEYFIQIKISNIKNVLLEKFQDFLVKHIIQCDSLVLHAQTFDILKQFYIQSKKSMIVF